MADSVEKLHFPREEMEIGPFWAMELFRRGRVPEMHQMFTATTYSNQTRRTSAFFYSREYLRNFAMTNYRVFQQNRPTPDRRREKDHRAICNELARSYEQARAEQRASRIVASFPVSLSIA